MHDQQTTPAPPRDGARRRRLELIGTALRTAAKYSLAEPELRGLGQLVGPGDVCMDIGAAYGMYSFSLARLVGPSGAVYSFEPQPKPRRILKTGVVGCGLGHVEVSREAMGAKPGTLEMAVPVKFGLPIHGHAHVNDGVAQPRPSSRFSRMRAWHAPITTIDAFRAARGIDAVRFIKVDAEGFEPEVVRGARELIEQHRPSWLLEVEDRHLSRYDTTAREFSDTLRDLGYAMHTWNGHAWTPTDRVTPGTRNYLFRSRED